VLPLRVFEHASALTAASDFPSASVVTTGGGVISSAGFNN
jgi:hypothetical protein